ncbi:acetate kinase [Streptococcus mutans]|uniref:acetate kinase n=1 Tax=Streptococcus mutans TaxID=1309 RepID=UPI00145542A9|nr:acetate kinase [Streptococcus mutans]MCB5034996.1 acetate kinase [Streptococcus mutans]MDT9501795.1 acetate kinase [Streptococcus mutans]NLQ47584.1 acetate kinase [Streptococcus mutans]NLQ91688.1 acetate kinase [Streptococcus mutans]UVT93574.1 acetate kinase [Streptococcus mutans]
MIDNLLELVKYHEGQIASRSLSKKLKTNNPITLYAMPAGESISNESSKLTKLIQVLEGSLQVEIAGEKHILNQQGLISIAVNQVHNLYALKDSKVLQIEVESQKKLI